MTDACNSEHSSLMPVTHVVYNNQTEDPFFQLVHELLLLVLSFIYWITHVSPCCFHLKEKIVMQLAQVDAFIFPFR